jgi:hypothetical protein
MFIERLQPLRRNHGERANLFIQAQKIFILRLRLRFCDLLFQALQQFLRLRIVREEAQFLFQSLIGGMGLLQGDKSQSSDTVQPLIRLFLPLGRGA